MKRLQLFLVLLLTAFLYIQCDNDDEMDDMMDEPVSAMFKISIQNVSEVYSFFDSGEFNTPDGADGPGPLMPGTSYSFSFYASKGHKLSFATMFVQSNDLFYGTPDTGLDLFTDDQALTGDITSMISLWDAGTEVNENPGTGDNQPMRQSGPNTGPAENGNVMIVNDGFTYPMTDQNIKVNLEYDGTSMFTVTIMNLMESSTPLAPGVWVVHDAPNALFQDGMPDKGMGLEALAEDGGTSALAEYLNMNSGYFSPLAPGVWAVYQGTQPLFAEGQKDSGYGLQALAENGDPSQLGDWLMAENLNSGVFNTPDGESGPGPLLPGGAYSFTVEASSGDYLSFATMLVHTNDLFYAPDGMGIKLFNNDIPINGDITSQIKLWDAGTEINEFPGAGIHQPARLNGGDAENGNVMKVNDGYTYPGVSQVIKVTVERM